MVRWGVKLYFTVVGQAQWVLTLDSVHPWWLYRATSLEHHATITLTCYPTQSHYPDTEPKLTSPCPILIMPSTGLGSASINFKVIGLTWWGFKITKSGFEPATFGFPERRALYLFAHPDWLQYQWGAAKLTFRNHSHVGPASCILALLKWQRPGQGAWQTVYVCELITMMWMFTVKYTRILFNNEGISGQMLHFGLLI